MFFSNDLKKEEEKKEKQRKEEIDKIIKEYNENKKNNDKKNNDNSSYAGISFKKRWANNDNLDRFLKCMSPSACVIFVGAVLWGIGFTINGIAEASPFLSALSIPKSITNVIATGSFWEVVLILSVACITTFFVWTILLKLKNSIKTSRGNCIESSTPKKASQLSIEMQKSPTQKNSYQNYRKKGIIDNNQTINKSDYNTIPLSKMNNNMNNNNFYKSEEKSKYLGVDINKNDKNKQKTSIKWKFDQSK